ncbi:MAG: alpha/beta hydrolase [Acidimicrobiia bacterium]|nr:alpha/beta hydrolase [Acidimicrobiia bacterium]
MERFTHAGIEVRYRRAGAGPAMIFLHNGGTSSTIWRHQFEDLQDGYDVLALDLPGFGCSPRPQDGIVLSDYVDVVAALIDELGLAPVVLVGNCMGSAIAAGVAAEHPDAVAALVLVNPLTEATFAAGGLGRLHTMYGWAPAPTRFARRIARRVVPPEIAAVTTVRFQIGPKGVARGVHHDAELVAANRRADQLPALVDVLDDMRAYRALDEELDLSATPLCTIWGAENRVLSPRAGRRLGEHLAPQRAEELPGCGHLPMLEDPAAVTSIIAEFASIHVPPRRPAETTP